ncbi:MAG: Zinc finger domain protein [Phycisphaerales bacterium]|nr:Zinc finger domain protein [Phycisphaerales bacterium]
MEGWTSQRVLQLAPDPASAKAGQGLASPRKWVTSGFDAAAAWGECQGSGSKPYQVQVELGEPAFKCSCPSRKFPCKHGLGLMLLVAGGQVKEEVARPAWVDEWLKSRTEKAGKKQAKAEAPPKPVDEAAQAKRRQQRLNRVGDGLAALKLWAEDLVRGGIAAVPGRPFDFFDEPARRLVDAQAPGAARRVRELASVAAGGAGWQRPFVEQLAALHLMAVAFERADTLPDDTRADLHAALGLPVPNEEVLARPPVHDRWQVVAAETTDDGQLRTRRAWLWGAATGRPATVLAFAFANAPLDVSLTPGFAFDGEVCFFPGTNTRALVKARGDLTPIAPLAGVDTLDALCDVASALRGRSPWADEVAVPVRWLVPVRRCGGAAAAGSSSGGGWDVVDRGGYTMLLNATDAAGWAMLAASGGHPVDLVLGFDGWRLRPLALAGEGGAFTPLAAGGAGDNRGGEGGLA